MKLFLLAFICFSIIFVGLAVLASSSTDRRESICAGLILALLVSAAGTVLTYKNEELWNDGYCECGTQWELVSVTRYKLATTKYYHCPNCHNEIEIK